jgi:hypothetical protein
VKWSREKISRCFYSFLRKLIFIRKDAKAEGEQREVSRLLEAPACRELQGIDSFPARAKVTSVSKLHLRESEKRSGYDEGR